MSWWPRYEKTSRIAVKDGIKARTSTFGKTWWARRWIEALQSLELGSRLERGRSYARSGQVIDYKLDPGEVHARVQGSRPKPYEVKISVKVLPDPAWEKALDALARRAEYAARLLNGDMPDDIDDVFTAAGTPLLPRSQNDLTTSCSCPDWANPCKHVAAVYYIVGEALGDDPFLLLALRGRGRDEVLAGLRARRGDEGTEVVEAPPARQTVSAETFWGAGPIEDLDMGLTPPSVRAAALRRLGAPGAWATPEEMRGTFGPLLTAASEAALRDAAGGA